MNIRTVLCWILTALAVSGYSQSIYPVKVTVNVLPPYTYYPQDYVNQPSKVQVILQSMALPGGEPHRLKLTASLSGDNGIVIRTKDSYQPLGPVYLQAGEMKMLTYDEISDVFTWDHFIFINTTKSDIIQNGLPEGNYTFCVRAFNFDNGEPLSDEEPFGCSNPVPVKFIDPPVIIVPENNQSVDPQLAQYFGFSWIPSIGAPMPVYYMLKIVEVNNPATDLNTLMNSTSIPYLLQENILTTNYQYTPADPPLESGKTYGCQVIAYDPQNQIKFVNDGKSVPVLFTVSEPEKPAGQPLILTAPYLSGTGHLKDSVDALTLARLNDTIVKYSNESFELKLAPDDFMFFAWTWEDFNRNQDQTIQYKISFYEMPEASIIKPKTVSPQTGKLLFSEITFAPQLRFFEPVQNCLQKGFKSGGKYGFIIQAIDVNKQNVLAEIEGRNFIFRIGEMAERRTVIKGRVLYSFDGLPEKYPVKEVLIVAKTDIPGEYSVGFTDAAGNFTIKLPASTSDSVRVNLSVKSPYYKQQESIYYVNTKSDSVAIGDIQLLVYSYSLRLELEKVFQEYENPQGGGVIQAEIDKKPAVKDHYVALYRKNKPKPAYLPVNEGMQNSSGYVSGMNALINYQNVAVAWAKTIVEYTSGNIVKSNYVKFDRLPLNLMNGDEYSVVVFDSTKYNEVTEVGTIKFIPNEFGLNNSINLQFNTNYQLFNTNVFQTQGGGNQLFINPKPASQSPIMQLQVEPGLNQLGLQGIQTSGFLNILDSLVNTQYYQWSKTHYDVKDTIEILSPEPPKSLITGKILYKWPTENISRPMPNAPFKIVVDYIFTVNGKSLALKEAEQHYNGKLVGPAPADLEMTVGTGKTDANGNFSIEVVNLNKKGIVSTSYLYIMENANISGSLKRVFRIQFNNGLKRYYYAPTEDIVVQAFNSINAGNFIAVVREAKIKVSLKDKTNPSKKLFGISVLAFREKIDPQAPPDHGNCNNLKRSLIRPVYGAYLYDYADYLNHEYYWIDSVFTDDEGVAKLPKLLLEPNSYYLQVATNPSDNTMFYKMRIEYLKGYSYYGVQSFGQSGPQNTGGGYISYTDDDFYVYYNCDNFTYQSYHDIDLVYWNQELYDKIDYTTYKVCLDPLPPRIAGKVFDSYSRKGVSGAQVSLLFNGSAVNPVKNTDNYGRFEYILTSGVNLQETNYYKLTIQKSGYKTYVSEGSIDKKGMQIVKDCPVLPDALVKGGITDEQGKPLAAYIQVGDGDIRDNQMPLGWFFYYTSSGNNKKLIIIPHDPAYFNDTLNINIPENGTLNVGYIKLFKRKHRIRFDVADADTKAPVVNATVTMLHNGVSVKTALPSSGFEYRASALFVFENVSVNNYRVNIKGPPGQGYIQKEFNLKNAESIDTIVHKIYLKKGKTISGVVKLNGTPVKHARVYADQSSFGTSYPDSLPDMTTFTGANGSFSLTGVPMQIGQTIKVYATLDTNFTVIGDVKSLTLNLQQIQGPQNVQFNLKRFTKMKIEDIYNFPLEIESLSVLNADSTRVKITGKVDLKKSSSPFTWIDQNTPLARLKDVELLLDPQDGKGKPVKDELTFNGLSSFRMQYANKMYNVLVHAPSTSTVINGHIFYFPNSLTLKKITNTASVRALVKIVDNSFNFPSTYLSFPDGEFYLKGDNENKLDAIKSTGFAQLQFTAASYPLCTRDGNNIKFKLLGFDATANAEKSTITASSGAISLDVKVNCKFPQAKPDTFSLFIPGLRIDNNMLHPYSSSTTLTFNLENWKIEVKNWKFKPDEGGIYASDQDGSKCVVKTNALDVPFGIFALRPDMFYFDQFKMNQIQLGGGLVLPVSAEAVPKLYFDPSCGIDQGPHWKLSILVPQGTNAAATISLPGVLSQTVNVEYINLLSNNERMIGIKRQPNILQNVCVFIPQTFYGGTNYFALSGELDLKAPRINPVVAELIVKNNNGMLSASFNPVNITFEGKGYVLYESKGKIPAISDKHFALTGTAREPDVIDTISGTLLIDGQYSVSNDKRNIRVQLHDDYNYPLNAKHTFKLNKKFSAETFNGMAVQGNDWDLLRFSGEILGDSTLVNEGKTTRMTFKVRGDVDVSPDELKVKDVPFTPPGTTFRYIFSEKRVVGSMPLNTSLFGPVNLNGVMEISIGSPGWYMCGAAEAKGLPSPIGSFAAGFLLGMTSNLPQSAKQTASQFSPAMPCQLTEASSFNGFYFTGKKVLDNIIPDLNVDVNLGVVAFWVKTQLPAIDAAVFANFSNGFQATLSAGVQASVHAGMSSITCTDLTGGVTLAGRVTAAVGDGAFQLSGNICNSMSLSFTQGVPIPFAGCETLFSLNKTLGIDVTMKLGTIDSFSMEILDNPCPTGSCF
ncbi:MAG: hypothetical protein AB9842_05290 [Bacteroidales bacterium]